jgi:hypothetical protein
MSHEIESSSGNVFTDLGLPEADHLLAEADANAYARLTAAHGVRVGQIYRHIGGADMEVVYVTLAFAVMHSTEVHEGVAGLSGIVGRYASPYVEEVDRIKNKRLDNGRPYYVLVKDMEERS